MIIDIAVNILLVIIVSCIIFSFMCFKIKQLKQEIKDLEVKLESKRDGFCTFLTLVKSNLIDMQDEIEGRIDTILKEMKYESVYDKFKKCKKAVFYECLWCE